MSMLVFWVLTPCGLERRFQRFGRTSLLHLYSWRCRQYVPPKRWYLPTCSHGVTTQKNIFTAVRTSNLMLEIGTTVISAVSPLDEHLSQTNTSCVPKFCNHWMYYCLIRYFLVRIRTTKCFTNSSKRFRCELMFKNEHAFCSWINHVCICTAFA
jgi:hypothetical protein